MRQLSANVVGYEDGLSTKALNAISSYSHERLAGLLQELCLHHVLRDIPVIIVVDNMHLAEQRIAGLMIYELRKALQPWFYNLKRQGYVRVIFSGRDGYSAPSGTPIATVQLNRLSESMAKHVLTRIFRARKKHISPAHVETLLKKKDAGRMQYLRVAASIVQRYWVFEQNNGYIEALPERLSELYAYSIRDLEADFGENLVEKVLVLLIKANPMEAPTFEEMKDKFSSGPSAHVADTLSSLFHALRELLRISPAASRCALVDLELAEAIRKRYQSGNVEEVRAEEARLKAREEELRRSQLHKCVATVQERHNGVETGCSSLHQAVDAAADGDEVVIHKKSLNLKYGLTINRNLKISCKHAETVVAIQYGQTVLQVGDDELHRVEAQEKFVVHVVGLKMRQFGFEAAEMPYCVRVSANAELRLESCQVTSDVAVGILVDDGTLVMENSQTVLCGGQVRTDRLFLGSCVKCKCVVPEFLLADVAIAQGLVVQDGGNAKLDQCQLVANWLPNISDAEKEMHEMFISFCKGETAIRYAREIEWHMCCEGV